MPICGTSDLITGSFLSYYETRNTSVLKVVNIIDSKYNFNQLLHPSIGIGVCFSKEVKMQNVVI